MTVGLSTIVEILCAHTSAPGAGWSRCVSTIVEILCAHTSNQQFHIKYQIDTMTVMHFFTLSRAFRP